MSSAPTVLLVDDEAEVRRVIRMILETINLNVVEADSVATARQHLSAALEFSLALVDRSMPGGGGELLIPDLRAACPEATLFYFTGEHVNSEDEREVDGVIRKPVSAKELLWIVRNALAI